MGKSTTDLVEMLLQLFIGKIDAKLLKAEKKYMKLITAFNTVTEEDVILQATKLTCWS